MPDRRTFVHRIDGDDIIDYVNEEWLEFAAENWDDRQAGSVVGTPLWDCVAHRTVRHVLRTVVERVRGRRAHVTLPYRCDSPDTRRHMEMDIAALAGAVVEFRSRIVREEEREPVPLLSPYTPRGSGLLVMCSWCKRVCVPPWMEAERAVAALGLFGRETVPEVCHGICRECRERILGSV